MTTSASEDLTGSMNPLPIVSRTIAAPSGATDAADRTAVNADNTIARAQAALIGRQHADGYWCAELQGDSICNSEYILTQFILGHDDDPNLPKIANHVRHLQQHDGGWNLYPGGASDVSGTVKAYFALKLMGDDPEAPHMRAARRVVHELGGAEKCNSFSNFYLAALGQISYDECPSIPPEIVLLPRWFYFNLYSVSAWTRTMILPLAIVSTIRPVRHLPPERGIAELYTGSSRPIGRLRGIPSNWREVFLAIDLALKLYRKSLAGPSSEVMRAVEKWLLDHMEGSEGLGGIFPPMVYILIALCALGYQDDHPVVERAHQHLRDLFIEEGDTIRVQPCFSPVWDTGGALNALTEGGMTPDIVEPAQRASDWLVMKEVRIASDWAVNCPPVEPSGWYFEFANPHYPDVDDTAMVVMGLKRVGCPAAQGAIRRGIDWMLAMQNEDGGWAAFDRTQDRPILEQIPFADHNAMQDPSCPDITGRVLECFGRCGMALDHPAVGRAIEYLQARQEHEGCWYGRWGVNYIYGTWQVLVGLKAIGERMTQRYVVQAAQWLREMQKSDGSWGESCDSYENPALKGRGQTTPSQTAWGMMGLMAVHGPYDPAVKKAAAWLVQNQTDDGAWEEHYCTGTGFPKVYYLQYHMYRLYYPLMALSRYRKLARG